MGTAASDIPLEFGANPGEGKIFGCSCRCERDYAADVFKDKFMQNHWEASDVPRGR